jgi:hypothetical protein
MNEKCGFCADTIDIYCGTSFPGDDPCLLPATHLVYLGEKGEEGWVPACAWHYDVFVEECHGTYVEPKELGTRWRPMAVPVPEKR